MKTFKRSILIVLLTSILFMGLGIGFALIYEDEIVAAMVNEINQQIDTEVQVESIDFSMLKKFPLAAVEFKKVYIKSAKSYPRHQPQDDTLAFINHLYLELDIFDLVQQKYSIEQIELKDGLIWMQQNRKAQPNFNITKAKTKQTPSKFSINLRKVVLKNIRYRYTHQKTHSQYDLYAEKYSLSGHFSDTEYTVLSKGNLLLNKLRQNGIDYLVYPRTRINVKLKVSDSQVDITSGKLWLGKERLAITGFYNWEKKGKFSIVAQSNQLSIENLIRHLPESYAQRTQAYQAKGNMSFILNISQDISLSKKPHLSIKTDIKDAQILKKSNQIALEDVRLSLKFDDRTKKVNIEQFGAKLNESWINGKAEIQVLKQLKVRVEALIESDLKAIQDFVDLEKIDNINGYLRADVLLAGTISQTDAISRQDINRMHLSGTLNLEQANILFSNSEHPSIQNLDAKIQLQNKHIQIDEASFNFNNTNTQFIGKAYNIVPYLLFNDEDLRMNGNLSCDKLNLDAYLTPKESSSENDDFTFPKRILARMNIKLKKLAYGKFKASNIESGFYMNDTCLHLAPFKTQIAEGTASGKIFLTKQPNGSFRLNINSETEHIDISKLMYQFNNFGQHSIEHKHLSGKLSAKTQFTSLLNSHLEFDTPSIWAQSDVVIKNGKLNQYKPLYKLSRFIKLEELQEIDFETLKNHLEIKNSKLYIPNMAIHSNALDLKMSGEHHFTGDYTYHLNILLSELLGRKARENKQENQSFGVVEDDGYGKTSLFIKVEGKDDDVRFKYDTKGVKEHIKKGFKKEKQHLKTILKDEFGLFKNDTTLKEQNTPKKSTKEQFQIEWED